MCFSCPMEVTMTKFSTGQDLNIGMKKAGEVFFKDGL